MKIFTGLIFLIIISMCNSDIKNSTMRSSRDIFMIQSKGLSMDNLRLNTLLFYSSENGFIGGSSDTVISNNTNNSDTFAFISKIALLYKTRDGGKTWIGKDFGLGFFTNFFKIEDTFYALKTSEDYSNITIYASSDFGDTWNEKSSFPNNIYYLVKMSNNLYALGLDSSRNETFFYNSNDNGETWTTSSRLTFMPFDNPVINNDGILYLSFSKSGIYFPDLLVFYNIENNTIKTIKLPMEFNCYLITSYDNKIKLTGLEHEHITVYSLNSDNSIKHEYTYSFNNKLFPQAYFDSENEEYIIAGEKAESQVVNRILKPIENGKTWEEINFLKGNYIKPFYFLNGNSKIKIWFYSGSGKFQILE